MEPDPWSRFQAVCWTSVSPLLLSIIFWKFIVTVESYGKANLIEPIPAYPDLIASICYTSVRVLDMHALELFNFFYPSFREQPAIPKVVLHVFQWPNSYWYLIGVLLSHKNLAISIQSHLYGMGLPEYPILISYLPLAHIYGVCSVMDFYYISMLTIPPSEFANLVSLPLADRLVTLLGIRCVSLKMLRF